MRRILIAILMLVCLTNTVHAQEWNLVWSDEFNVNGLPDSTKWGYEVGYIRNNELQYYTRARMENARLEDGLLVIEGRKEMYDIPDSQPDSKRGNADYTAASLTTQNKANWTYGRIEVRAKLPRGQGVWPAIWTLGANIEEINWPRCGEIDIMEYIGREPTTIHGTLHYAIDGRHQGNGKSIEHPEPFTDFHIYAAEWYPDRIDIFFDDNLYQSFNTDTAGEGEDNPFRKPHYLLINLALGGNWGGELDDSILPQRYLIDYVRVYEQIDP